MGIKSITQTDSTSINTKNSNDREKIVQDYYQFFNYKDKDAWGENKDLYEKYLYEAESSDYHSEGGNIVSDGYLSKKEYQSFLTKLKNEDKERFNAADISDEEKVVIKEDTLYPKSWHDSQVVTSNDKKFRKGIGIFAAGGTIASLTGAILTSIGVAKCDDIQKGTNFNFDTIMTRTKIGKYTGNVAAGTTIALGATLISLAALTIHRKIVDNRINRSEQN